MAAVQPMQFRNWQDAQRSGVNVVIGRTNPRKPDELEYEDGALNYLWPITPQENERVVELLEVADPEFEAPSVWVIVPQYNCTGCGKLAGFADSVYTALVDGVHSKSFMIKALQGKLTNKQPPRWVKCAGCATPSPYMLGWPSGFGWNECKEGKLCN